VKDDRTIEMGGTAIPSEATDTIWIDKGSDDWGREQQWLMPEIRTKQSPATHGTSKRLRNGLHML